jgi:hypothetical protein
MRNQGSVARDSSLLHWFLTVTKAHTARDLFLIPWALTMVWVSLYDYF